MLTSDKYKIAHNSKTRNRTKKTHEYKNSDHDIAHLLFRYLFFTKKWPKLWKKSIITKKKIGKYFFHFRTFLNYLDRKIKTAFWGGEVCRPLTRTGPRMQVLRVQYRDIKNTPHLISGYVDRHSGLKSSRAKLFCDGMNISCSAVLPWHFATIQRIFPINIYR